MSLEQLVEALKEDRNLPPTWETVLPYIDGPEFFGGLIKAKFGNGSYIFKGKLYQNQAFARLLRLNSTIRTYFCEFINSLYSTLDDIVENIGLSSLMNLKDHKTSTLVKAFVDLGILSSELPDNHSIGITGHASWCVKKDIVGEEQAL